MKSFGQILATLRYAAGLTQEELGARAGIHRVSVARLELGTRRPTWESVLALAIALDVTPDVFTAKGEKK